MSREEMLTWARASDRSGTFMALVAVVFLAGTVYGLFHAEVKATGICFAFMILCTWGAHLWFRAAERWRDLAERIQR